MKKMFIGQYYNQMLKLDFDDKAQRKNWEKIQTKKEKTTRSETFFLAASKLDSCQVNQVHAVQVVVYEKLQQVGDVALMRLVTLVHHSSALQQLAHSATNTDCSI